MSVLGLLGVGGAGSAPLNVPTHSLDFEASSTQSLSMSDGDFGAFTLSKWAISGWWKKESTGAKQYIISTHADLTTRGFGLWHTSGDAIQFNTYNSGTKGSLVTNATYADTDWHHILVHYDFANATAGDRMRMWVDGSEITSFMFDTNPTTDMADPTAGTYIGQSGGNNNYFDGLINQLAFFDNYLPAIGEVWSASGPVDITGVTGLKSILSVPSGVVTTDGVHATAWTNNNGVTASTTIP